MISACIENIKSGIADYTSVSYEPEVFLFMKMNLLTNSPVFESILILYQIKRTPFGVNKSGTAEPPFRLFPRDNWGLFVSQNKTEEV